MDLPRPPEGVIGLCQCQHPDGQVHVERPQLAVRSDAGAHKAAAGTKPIPRWDAHFGILKTTHRTPRLLISPLGPNWGASDRVV